jgi:uncharacterized protein YjiS (DUF1127 family)
MTSLSTGASRKVPAAPRLSNVRRASSRPAEFGRPDVRWRSVGNPLGRALLWLFFAAARPLVVWQKRLRDRAYLQRMPDYLLRDIGIDIKDIDAEISKPFWRR